MCSTDFDPAVLWHETLRKARKPHECYECGLPIPVGRHYVNTVAIQERGDRPEVYAVHAECEALREFVAKEICAVEEERERKAWREKAQRHAVMYEGPPPQHGSILMGGLEEEINSLDEYRIPTRNGGMGSPKGLCHQLWEMVKAEYRQAAA